MSGMTVYFIRRLMLVPITFLCITLMVYSILRVVPGGPIEQAEARIKLSRSGEAGGGGDGGGDGQDMQLDASAMRELEAYYALDKPILVGYLQWLGALPRDRLVPVPPAPERGNEAAKERLFDAGDNPEALAAAERETGFFLRYGRLYRLAIKPLAELREAADRVDGELGELLEDKGLTAYGGYLHRPLTDEESAARADLIEKAEKLAHAGYGKRDELFALLDGEGLTWSAGTYFIRLTESELAADRVFTDRALALLDARRLAELKFAEIRESAGFEINEDGRVYRVESGFSGILQLDFGNSYTYNEPVLGLIGSKMEVSIQFGLIGYLLSWLICVPLGVMKAIKHRTSFDTVSSVVVFLGYSIPGFVLCLILLSTVAVNVDWLPLGGYKPPNIEELGWLDSVIGRIRHMIIPVAGYMIGGFATMTILMKNSLLENLGQDYVRTAFAKGLKERRVIFVHALRNSLIPVTAGIGHALGLLFAGSFLIEKTCNIDGMGYLGFQAIGQRDYPIILGLLVFLVLIRLFGNIISDIIWALIDPRIRFGS
jgi:microcin C transport system permease protein